MRKSIKSASKLLVLFFVLAFSASIFMSETLANSEDTATTSIERAENALVSAYQAVLDVERIGADVSGLLAELNEAGEFLAEANMEYRLEDFDEAARFADLGRDIGEEVESKTHELKNLAWSDGVQRMWLTMIGSVLGVILIALGSFWIWRFLKRRYS
ncbi:MAG: hypothetical protein JSV12_00850 [Candidatus Bathyarchaeota archaeon]|nr:MAG: hypothetical protein JSV12_00850 [Candidatus Bathyarchaeota archaeon]